MIRLLPRSPRLRFWLAYTGAWLALGAWLGSNVLISFHNNGVAIAAWKPMSWEISSALVVGALALAIHRFEQRIPLTGAGWTQRWLWHLPAALVFSLLHTLGIIALRRLVYAVAGSAYDFGAPLVGFFYELQKDLITYASIVIACIAWRTLRQRREQELLLLRSQRDLDEARLTQLTTQIQPHFVFNTLNAIANRMHEDVDAADRLLVAFSDLLRASLAADSAQTRVADEALWLQRYFALMSERFRGQLQTGVHVSADAQHACLPRLLLQPLAENALRHGLADGKGRVDVRIERHGDRLRCTVEDNGRGLAADHREGLGLSNVRRRLELLYPLRHRFVMSPRAGGGTRVELDLPLDAP